MDTLPKLYLPVRKETQEEVRVDVFKKSGKFYETIFVTLRADDKPEDGVYIDWIRKVLVKTLTEPDPMCGTRIRLGGMWAVIRESEYVPFPMMLTIPEA